MISQDILRKYIMYAKQNVRPVLGEGDDERIEVLYSELRNASRSHGGIPMTVRHIESIVRMAEAHARMHLRNFVRSDDISGPFCLVGGSHATDVVVGAVGMSSSKTQLARPHLISTADSLPLFDLPPPQKKTTHTRPVAMRVMIGSFISSQKLSVQKRLERQFAKYMAYKRDANELLFYMLNGLVRDNLSYLEIYHSAEAPSSVDVTIEEFKQKVRLGGLQSRGGWQRCLGAALVYGCGVASNGRMKLSFRGYRLWALVVFSLIAIFSPSCSPLSPLPLCDLFRRARLTSMTSRRSWKAISLPRRALWWTRRGR